MAAEIPYDFKIDDKNRVIDGRDLALKCMMHAYQLLGAYANGDPETYRKLIHATQLAAHTELDMRGTPGDPPVPLLALTLDDPDGPVTKALAAERFRQHLIDTDNQTRVLISMAEGSGA